MEVAKLREFLGETPGAAWLIRRWCDTLLPEEVDPVIRLFLVWLKDVCEAHAEEKGHLA